jgi:hypothetical protein
VDVDSSAALATGLLEGQGWRQMGELGAALVLSAGIGVEREIRQKNAGLRTHTLVGLGAALFMLISKYGFNDVLQTGVIVLDTSRMAAQIVSGIGFIGAGLIFVRRDSVRGLTTAASDRLARACPPPAQVSRRGLRPADPLQRWPRRAAPPAAGGDRARIHHRRALGRAIQRPDRSRPGRPGRPGRAERQSHGGGPAARARQVPGERARRRAVRSRRRSVRPGGNDQAADD